MQEPQSFFKEIYYKYIIACLLGLALCGHLPAQHQFFYKDVFEKNVGFEATPTCMVEDADGFFWVGTEKGLYRFDGSLAQKAWFAPNYPEIDNNSRIHALAIDNLNSIIWVTTTNGVFQFYWRIGISKQLAPEIFSSKIGNKIPADARVFVDRQGEAWINFAFGLTQVKNGGSNAQSFFYKDAGLPNGELVANIYGGSNTVQCITQDALQDSIIWAGTMAGLIRFNKRTQSLYHYFYPNPDKSLAAYTNNIRYILAYSDGKIYLGTRNGLLVFDPATAQFSHHPLYPPLPSGATVEVSNITVDFIAPYSVKKLLVSQGDEVFVFDTQMQNLTKIQPPADIDFIDKAVNIWDFVDGGIALYHHIKNQINRLRFPNNPKFKLTRINCIWEDTSTQIIYVRADFLQGLPAYDRRSKQWRVIPFQSNKVIIPYGTVLEKIAGGILANDKDQLYLMAPEDDKFKLFPIAKGKYPGMPRSQAWMVSQKAPDGSLFISDTRGYLYWLKYGANHLQSNFLENTNEPYLEHSTAPIIRAIDAQNRPWISCQGGFSIFIPEENRFINTLVNGYSNNHFQQYRQFTQDQQGRMWCLGPNEIGWIAPDHPEQGLQQRFGQSNGYALKDLYGGFDLDRNGMFWFTSDDNLAKFDPVNLKLTLFEGWGKEFPTVLDGGEIAFRNIQGIGIMDPDSIRPNNEQPRPYITWLKVFDNEKVLSANLFAPVKTRLQPEENFFTIGFSALGFFNSLKFRFAYMLEGVDRDWVYPERGTRSATYTGVKGGDYIFRLKVANGLGEWSSASLQWRIIIGTPWWATLWFRLLALGIILIAVAFFWLRNRLNQQKIMLENQKLLLEKEQTLRQERDRIASEMHDDLGAGLSTIRMLSLAAKRHESDPAKSVRIDKIAQSAADVMEKMADIISVMNSRNDTLENFAAYIRRYAGEYLSVHGLELNFQMPDIVPPLSLSGIQRRNLLLAVKECLHNVVKHAEANKVQIQFSFDQQLILSIRDNGNGIPEGVLQRIINGDQTVISNGLHNLRERMASLGGTVSIQNNGGTKIVLETGIILVP